MNIDEVPVAILAGGLGTRIKSLSRSRPKALIELAGKPFIIHQLEWLRSQGARRVVLCVGYRGEMVSRTVGNGRELGLQVEYSHDGPLLLGTAGAIHAALPLLGKRFFVLYGDTYLDCDLRAILRKFSKIRTLALMTVFRNDNRWGASNVKLASGRIMAYDKIMPIPGMRHIDYGLGLFRREAFDLAPGRRRDLAEVYQSALQRRKLAVFEVFRRYYEIGSLRGLREARHYLQDEGRLAQ